MKTVIEMAREADIELDLIDEDEGQVWYITKAGLERLAELVRADAIANEREACAKVCEEYETNNDITATWLNIVAEAIRNRSNT